MALRKVSYTNNVTVIGADNLNGIQDQVMGNNLYGICNSSAGDQTKDVPMSAINLPASLQEGYKATVWFSSSNTNSEPYLKIGSWAAKPIIDSDVTWSANTIIEFTYRTVNDDGWVVTGRSDLGNVAGLSYTVVSTF